MDESFAPTPDRDEPETGAGRRIPCGGPPARAEPGARHRVPAPRTVPASGPGSRGRCPPPRSAAGRGSSPPARPGRIAAVPRRRVHLGRIDDIDQMMRNPPLLAGGDLVGPDIEAAIDRGRVASQDLAPTRAASDNASALLPVAVGPTRASSTGRPAGSRRPMGCRTFHLGRKRRPAAPPPPRPTLQESAPLHGDSSPEIVPCGAAAPTNPAGSLLVSCV